MRILLVVIVSATLGVSACVAPSNTATPWTKGASSTTCGDWLNVMNDGQRHDLADTVLAADRAKAASDQARANLESETVSDYVSMATDVCRDDSASSLVFP